MGSRRHRTLPPHTWAHLALTRFGPVVLLVGALVLIGNWEPRSSIPVRASSQRLSKRDAEAASHQLASYIVRATRPDGQFAYRERVHSSRPFSKRYNVIRHAGTIYALSSYQTRFPDRDVRFALERSSDFLKHNCIAPVEEAPNALAVWSDPALEGTDAPLAAKLGGTGLGLAALCAYEQVEAGSTPLTQLQSMGRFLLFMQKADGSFCAKYIPAEGGRDDQWISLYYPGEAALGLIMLHELDADPLWLSAGAKALAHLASRRRGQVTVEADHWALLATERLLKASSLPSTVDREALLYHARQICESILEERIEHPSHSRLAGCFTKDGRTTPTSTRLEGLLAALAFLPSSESSLRRRTELAVDDGIAFLSRSQIKSGEQAGAMPGAIAEDSEASHSGGPADEIRIDYVQHALSALLAYSQQQLERKGEHQSKSY